MPMSTTHTSPAWRGPSRLTRPALGRPSVTVVCACTVGAEAPPASASSPDGRSTETTRAPDVLMAWIQSAKSPSGGLDSPVPKMPSSTTSAPLRVGRALDDKGAIGVMTVDGIGLRDAGAQQLREEVRGDRADLRELECGVAERAVVDGHLHALRRLVLLRECPRPADPRHHPAQLVVEFEALQTGRDGRRMAGGHPREDFVQRLRAAHVLHLLEHHRCQLPVALGEHRIGPLGEREEEGRPAAPAAFRVADHEAFPLEVGEVLAHRVGGDPEVGADRLGAGVAFTPEQLQDFHAGGTAGDGDGHIRTLARDASTAPGYLLQVDLDKIPTFRKLGCEEVLSMIKQASRAIEHMTAKERRIQRAKYARRNKMHLIDKLLNELEMLNLADQRQMPPVLSVAINKVIEESPEVTVLAQAKPASVMEAMDALYEIQDSLMYNQIEDE